MKLGKKTPFTILTNNIKYLGVTLTKQVNDLYDKNFKSLKKVIEVTFLTDCLNLCTPRVDWQ